MTIRFAPARTHVNFVSVAIKGWGNATPDFAANDNSQVAANDDALLAETLRHFSEHGLCAAERARDKAVMANDNGDDDGYVWWLSICRMLDRRMAYRLISNTS